jgi:nicotinamidase/pyrazinamidase
MGPMIPLHVGDSLILVDIQNDFLPGGILAVPDGDKVIPPLNRALFLFGEKGLPIFATRDWHPPKHISFREQGGLWPAHCVQHTRGASFASALDLPCSGHIISKSAAKDVYSGFDGTDLHLQLQSIGVNRLFVGGLATDYCVKFTVLDARDLGYRVYVLTDCIRAVNMNPNDGKKALAEMEAAGAIHIQMEQIAKG